MEAKDRAHEVRQRVVAKVGRHICHAQALPRHQLHRLHQHQTVSLEDVSNIGNPSPLADQEPMTGESSAVFSSPNTSLLLHLS